MDNATPLKKAKKPIGKFFLIANLFLVLIIVGVGAVYIRKIYTGRANTVGNCVGNGYDWTDSSRNCFRSTSGQRQNAFHYFCPDGVSGGAGCSQDPKLIQNAAEYCFEEGCGVEQIDLFSGCFMSRFSPPCTKEGPTNTPVPPSETPTPTVPAATSTPTPTPTQTPTPTPSRSALCDSSKISRSTISSTSGPITVTMSSKQSSITAFSLAFYSLDNPNSKPNDPEPIFFVSGTHFIMSKNASSPTSTMDFTINFSDIDKPDLNNSSKKPTHIQVNGYFRDPATGLTSLADPNCVKQFSLTSAPTLTPTQTPTPTPTTPPGQPTNTPAPTLTSTPGPTTTLVSVPCGTKSCDNATNPCRSDYVCIQANDGSNYCSSPDFVAACKINPTFNACCTSPGSATATPTTAFLAEATTAPTKTASVPSVGTTPWGIFAIIGAILLGGLLL